MGYRIDEIFERVHSVLASVVQAAGPWAVPMVLAGAGLVAMTHRDRMVSGYGVFLILATAGLVVIIYAFQNGRI